MGNGACALLHNYLNRSEISPPMHECVCVCSDHVCACVKCVVYLLMNVQTDIQTDNNVQQNIQLSSVHTICTQQMSIKRHHQLFSRSDVHVFVN